MRGSCCATWQGHSRAPHGGAAAWMRGASATSWPCLPADNSPTSEDRVGLGAWSWGNCCECMGQTRGTFANLAPPVDLTFAQSQNHPPSICTFTPDEPGYDDHCGLSPPLVCFSRIPLTTRYDPSALSFVLVHQLFLSAHALELCPRQNSALPFREDFLSQSTKRNHSRSFPYFYGPFPGRFFYPVHRSTPFAPLRRADGHGRVRPSAIRASNLPRPLAACSAPEFLSSRKGRALLHDLGLQRFAPGFSPE